jgi:hypothetical protein
MREKEEWGKEEKGKRGKGEREKFNPLPFLLTVDY